MGKPVPVSFTPRGKSKMPSFSPSAMWSSGWKSKVGIVPTWRTSRFAELSGPVAMSLFGTFGMRSIASRKASSVARISTSLAAMASPTARISAFTASTSSPALTRAPMLLETSLRLALSASVSVTSARRLASSSSTLSTSAVSIHRRFRPSRTSSGRSRIRLMSSMVASLIKHPLFNHNSPPKAKRRPTAAGREARGCAIMTVMKRGPNNFDFVYAVRNTRIVRAPERLLDPFDQTLVNYTLLAQPMDDPTKTRVREGKLQTFPPRLLLPGDLSTQELEGFGPQAQDYLSFLRAHGDRFRVLRYSYRLRRETYSETLIGEPLEAVRDRAKRALERKADPYAALVVGVDEPWDVCLLHLFMRLVQASLPKTLHALTEHEKAGFRERMPQPDRDEVERAFAAAAKDPTLIKPLGRLLKEKGLFELYQDRFFALVRD